MSPLPSTPLKIKRGEGWFAADRSWQSALQKLSDGALKLFVRYCQVKWNSRVLEAKSVVGRT